MQTITLNGDWQLYRSGENESIPATVPGCVHTDLLSAGRIEDPYFRDNELNVLWVGETDWIYRRTFDVPRALLAHDRVLLRCEGLDTLAAITLNGHLIGRTDNMFRTYEYDVRDYLVEGANQIEVRFDSPMRYVRKRGQERYLPAWGVGEHKLDGGGWIRKEPCNFGWDWGPMLATCGIWRDIELVAYDTARLQDAHILQDHERADGVGLDVRVSVEGVGDGVPDGLSVDIDISLNGRVVARATQPVRDGRAVATLVVQDPQLWWPNGMGDQPLYEVDVQLCMDDALLDQESKRIGLRTLKLVRQPDEWGESFYFAANGVPFFAKGANWIPAETFATRITRDDYARLLQDAVDANMNMLRVWGGGLYEMDVFYDLCDELGICVWQDFIFSCATYPAFDRAWMENVRAEAEDNVRRIRHHASLALWCGNNELEQGLVGDEWSATTMSWADYSPLFDEMLPEVVGRLDPQTDYWPSSPHTPVGDRRDFNNPDSGDAHLWQVWHGKMPFEWYRTCTHRFNSEFGFQSFPEPKTTYSYTLPEDRNITSYVMEHHQRSGIGNTTIMTYMLDWFRLPTSFEMTLWLSQILQGMAIKYAVEHWRRAMPRGMGTLYWQINDCWPVASWSSIDSMGRWKALHYMAREFYAPLLVSGLEDWDRGTVELHVTSDLGQARSGHISWVLTDVAGTVIAEGNEAAEIAPRADTLVNTLDLREHLEAYGRRRMLLWLTLDVEGETVSTNLVTFCRPKHLELALPHIESCVESVGEGEYRVTLTTDRPALWAWLELTESDARYSRNFVHLRPGVPVEIVIRPQDDLTTDMLREQLRVYSLMDTYR